MSDDRVSKLYSYARGVAFRRCIRRGVKDQDEREDAMSEALMALVEADTTFDPDKGMTWRTYAHQQIEWRLSKYFSQRRDELIPVPAHVGREGAAAQTYAPLYGTVGAEEDEQLTYDDVLSGDSPDPGEEIYEEEVGEVLREFLSGLLPEEESVLRLLVGMDCEPLSQEDAASAMGISRRTLARSYERALSKLRARGVGAALGREEPLNRFV